MDSCQTLGGYGFIATKDDGTTWVWGNNTNAELGLNDKVSRSSPHQLPGTSWHAVNDYADRTGSIQTSSQIIKTP